MKPRPRDLYDSCQLDRDSLDDVAADFAMPAVVQPRCSWVGMASELLNVLQWNALPEQVGDRSHANGMR